MPFTEAQAQNILNKLLRNTNWTHATDLYLSIHTAAPGNTGANEYAVANYDGNRPSITFAAPVAKVCASSNAQEFNNVTAAATITHLGLWDAATGGNFIWGNALAVTRDIDTGDSVHFSIGNVEAELDP